MVDDATAQWFVERGIAEHRALLTERGVILAAKAHWPGELFAGQRLKAKLTSKPTGSRRGTAAIASGEEILIDHLPPPLTEGETVSVTVTRGAIAEKGRTKRAQGRFSPDSPVDVQWLDNAQKARQFASGMWEEIWDAAASGEVAFVGGTLSFHVTPAMTLIDIDGGGSARELSLAAVPAIAEWLALFDLGGSIGIDFPTIPDKAGRKDIDAALATALTDWPHERTAMNGFGFVQIVARCEGPSLLHRFAASRTRMCARMALRRGELAAGTGPVLLLTVHPALQSKLKSDWVAELARRTGKLVRIETSPALALEASQAQIIAE